MAAANPIVPCPRCGGTGHTGLDKTLHDCLDALREGTPATSTDIHTRMKARGYRVTPNATMNQLAKLCRLGLAVRRGKQGKWWLYRLPNQ